MSNHPGQENMFEGGRGEAQGPEIETEGRSLWLEQNR